MTADVEYEDGGFDNDEEGFKDKLRQFCDKSSVFALGRIHSGSRLQRLLWTLMVIFMTVMFCIQVKQIFITFFSYPFTVEKRTTLERKLDFPAITVCNLNPARLSIVEARSWTSILKIKSAEKETDVLFAMAVQSPINEQLNVSYFMPKGFNKWNVLDQPYGSNPKEQESYYDTMDTCSYVPRMFKAMVRELSWQEQEFLAHQKNDFIISCKWLGMNCSPKNFTTFFDPSYTVCHTFNSGRMTTDGKVPGTLTVAGSGPMNSLQIEFFIEQDEYVNTLSPQAGVRLQIHDPQQMPFPAYEGFSISPGYATSVGLKMTDYTNLQPPYGDCQNTSDNTTLYYQFGSSYSIQACRNTCMQNLLNTKCNCSLPDFPFNESYTEYVRMCDIFNDGTNSKKGIDSDCVVKLFDDLDENDVCNCPRKCREKEYNMLTSTSQYPSQMYKRTLEQRLKQTSTKTSGEIDVASNIVKLQVYFQDMERTSLTASESYLVDKLLGDLGGLLGLWLGFSFITIAELGEFMVDIMRVFGKKYMKKQAYKWPSLANLRALKRDTSNTGNIAQVKPFVEQTISLDKF